MFTRIVFALLLLAAAPLQAAPRVVVSVAPLHSLVAALMEGVAEPELLLHNAEELQAAKLTRSQMRLVLQADLLLWAGPELETALATALEQTPASARQAMMLSHHLPLLPALPDSPLAQHGAHHHTDGIARDPRFWLDPRLAAIAIHHITPYLVRLDPDHTERYLDNEIRLLARLRQAESELRLTLAALEDRAVQLGATAAPYFYHRFGLTAAPSHHAGLTTPALNCFIDGRDVLGDNLATGTDLYFRLLQRQAAPLLDCDNTALPQVAVSTAKL